MPRIKKVSRKLEEDNVLEKGLFDGINLSETLILATVPFGAYLIVFFYELGYFSVFKIPIGFASFDLSSIFVAMFSVIILAAGFYYFSELFLGLFSSQPEPIIRRIKETVYPIAITVTLGLFTISSWELWLFTFAVLLLVSLPTFITPLLKQRKVKGYLAKLIAEDKSITNRANNELSAPLKKIAVLLGRNAFVSLMVFSYVLFLTYQLGQGAARNQKEFRVLNTSPEQVVLWIFDGHAVCASFDRVTKEIDAAFVVHNIGNDPSIQYRLEQIGPLKIGRVIKTPTLTPQSPITVTPQNTTSPTISLSNTATKIIVKTTTPTPSASKSP